MEKRFLDLLSDNIKTRLDTLLVTASLINYNIIDEEIDNKYDKYDKKKEYKTFYFIGENNYYELTFEMFENIITGLHAIIYYSKNNDYDDVDDAFHPTDDEIIRVIDSLMKKL